LELPTLVLGGSLYDRSAEVKSSLSTTNAATFSLGYVASFPTTINGEYDNATSASRTLDFIFHVPLLPLDFSESLFANTVCFVGADSPRGIKSSRGDPRAVTQHA
jgi:hypothetical protein